MTTRVGFVGLGNIGKPMALRLAAAEQIELTVFDVLDEPVLQVAAAGARAARDLAELADRSDVVCLMVRDDAQVHDVVGQLASCGHPLTVLVHSTVAPGTPAALAEQVAAHGITVLDAPVSGGPAGAKAGTLAIMVGGSADAFAAARPALDVLGSEIVHAGPVGSGTRFKLARNLLHFVSFTAATEAQRLAERAGLDLAALGRVVRHTDAITGGTGAIMLRESTAPIDPSDFWHPIFTHVVALGEKDLSFAIELADELGVEVPLALLARERLAAGLGVGSATAGRS